ncbi:MAG: hypothetical protein GXO66_01455 [Euryarchaeota archaeon]|nr:hypothetical protein [Euryarchaeota archaeon]
MGQGVKVEVGKEWSKLWNTEDWWAVWEALLKLSGYGAGRNSAQVEKVLRYSKSSRR